MNKIFEKKNLLKSINVLLGCLLSLLGLDSCDKEDPWNNACYYGSPYAEYEVSGAVLNTEGKALAGISITAKEIFKYEPSDYTTCPTEDTTATKNNGEYLLTGTLFANVDSLRIIAQDPAGVYETDSLDIKLEHTDEGAGNWKTGTDVGIADFKLKKK